MSNPLAPIARQWKLHIDDLHEQLMTLSPAEREEFMDNMGRKATSHYLTMVYVALHHRMKAR